MEENNPVLKQIKTKIEEILIKQGVESPAVELDRPTDFKFGDLASNAALKYAKVVKQKPMTLAEAICRQLTDGSTPDIKTAEVAAPGFINITFNHSVFKRLLEDILKQGPDYGRNQRFEGQKWVVEHTSPNPNKAMHLGHLRNNLTAMGLIRTLSAGGAEVISEAVDNNRGIAIAKLMYGFLIYGRKEDSTPIELDYWFKHPEKWYSPDELDQKPDIFASRCYSRAQSDFKTEPKIEAKVRQWVTDWEAGEEKVWALWTKVLSFIYRGQSQTLNRLGSYWDHIWHEHEHYEKGKQYIEQGLKKEVFQKLEDGGVLSDLAEYDLPDTIVLKKDGTSLYITQDIALTAMKKDLHRTDKLIWVIGPEQVLAMQQLFAICEQLSIGRREEFTHLSYGAVRVKDSSGATRKMSSREGTEVFIDELINEIKDRILEQNLNQDQYPEAELRSLSEKLALAAVKFEFLKPDRTQSMTFDPERSIRTTGDSGVYALYSFVRTRSILRKKPETEPLTEIEMPAPELEANLIKLLIYFPRVIRRAQEDLSVHHLAQYLLELCSEFNSWYEKETILDGSKREDYKLAVVAAVGQVIKNGLEILGIDTVERV